MDVACVGADVACVGAIRQDVGNIFVEEGRFLKPPIHLQDEIAILAVAPERLVTQSLALGIVVDDAIDDLPVSVIASRHFPPAQVLTIEERDKPLGRCIVCRPCREAEQ